MLTLQQIKKDKDLVINLLGKRNHNFAKQIEEVVETDNKRKKAQTELDNCLAESKLIAKEIGSLFRQKRQNEAIEAKKKAFELKEKSKIFTQKLKDLKLKLTDLLYAIPNIPHISVPAGKTENDNELIREGGKKPEFNFKAIPHWELAKKFDIIDFELGNKITGAGFPVYKGKGAKLQRALINFFLNEAEKEGYEEIMPPLLINEESGLGTGQLPDKEGQMYQIINQNLYLIPTAEVPVTNLYRNTIVNSERLPIKMTAYSSCFRREAGSYGKEVRGLNRLHQFDKVEIVQITEAEKSYETLDKMVNYVENIIRKLELPYRIVKLCGGDLGFTSALTYDFEVYSAGQKKWLEVSSVSNFESYQSNRLKLRCRKKGEKKTRFAHTLNGSALALPRIVAALLENNQTENEIKIPKAIAEYSGFNILK